MKLLFSKLLIDGRIDLYELNDDDFELALQWHDGREYGVLSSSFSELYTQMRRARSLSAMRETFNL